MCAYKEREREIILYVLGRASVLVESMCTLYISFFYFIFYFLISFYFFLFVFFMFLLCAPYILVC